MTGKEVLRKLSAYKQGRQIEEIKKEYGLNKIIKLASNENPFGYSSDLSALSLTALQELNIYPDGHASEVRMTVAHELKVDENSLVFGAGSDELIQMICRTYLYPGVNTVMATPTFSQYKHHSLIEGATVKEVETKEGYHNLEGMLECIDSSTRVVWLCAPDNPTGTLVSKGSFYDFMARCPKNVLVVLDEAYYEFVEEDKRLDALELLSSYQNLIVLRTFSKAYGLAALRIGYGVMDEVIASKLNIVRAPFNTSVLAQKAANIAFKDQTFINDTVSQNKINKESFLTFLDTIGWSYYESHTNFVLVSTPLSGLDMFDKLISHGYIIRPGELLGYPNTIRVTIGLEKDMIELQNILKKILIKQSNEG